MAERVQALALVRAWRNGIDNPTTVEPIEIHSADVALLERVLLQHEEQKDWDLGNAIGLVKTAIGIVADEEPQNHAIIKKALWNAVHHMQEAQRQR